MQLSDLIALAAMLRPPPGPQIPEMAKAPNNVTATPMSRAALNAPSDNAPQMLAAMIGAAGAPAEIQLRQAQTVQANALADALKASAELPPPMFAPGGAPMSLAPMAGTQQPAAPADTLVSGGALSGGGSKLNFDDLRALAQKAGFKGDAANVMAATSLAESGGDPNAIGDRNIGGSFGITQINQKAHGPVAQEALGNPGRAMQLAFDISKGGTDFSPWTMFNNGQYQQYMPTSNVTVPGALSPGNTSAFNPGYLSWAQQQDRINTLLGKRNPVSVDEALKLQFAPMQEQVKLQFAGPLAAATKGGEFPYTSALNTQQANQQLRNQLAGLGLQLNTDGSVSPIPNFSAGAAALEAAKAQGQRAVTEPSDIRISQAKEGLQQVPQPGGGYRLEPIPGSPTESAAREQQSAKDVSAEVVNQAVNRAFELSGAWTTGLPGSQLRNIPGTPAFDLARTLDTMKSNAGFERLSAMRRGSPTGGALGPVSDTENKLLQSSYASLEQSQSREQFETNLSNFRNTFLDVVYGSPERLKEMLDGGKITQREYDSAMHLRGDGPGSIGSAPSQIRTKDEYDKLPPGATFTAPDGSLRRKPGM